jgi:hypothetical protein
MFVVWAAFLALLVQILNSFIRQRYWDSVSIPVVDWMFVRLKKYFAFSETTMSFDPESLLRSEIVVEHIAQTEKPSLTTTDDSNSIVFFGICYTFFKVTIFFVHLLVTVYFFMWFFVMWASVTFFA